jgi:argininosuccinate synthase
MSDRPTQRIASYEADPEKVGRVLLLYSGGLDTSVMLRWIQERYGAEVVTLTVNLGQPGEDWDVVVGKARELGVVDAIVVDAREEFARDYIVPAIKANALYGGGYPLFTALGRPLIAKLAVEQARATGCDTVAHGCTGKGNDQVRIEATVATLDPGLKLIAPVREWQMGREEEITYAREHGIPVKGGSEAPPYSIDDNLWGRSSEGGGIEDLASPAPEDVFQLITPPTRAPDEPELVRVGFERGCPATLNGAELGLVELLERAAELGRRHGVGIVDQVEDRVVGLKIRDIYEIPAAAIILPAHRELEKLAAATRPRRLHGVGQPAGDRRGDDEVVQGFGNPGGAELSTRAVRSVADLVRRIRRRVQPGREPRVHRAVHASEPDGASDQDASG